MRLWKTLSRYCVTHFTLSDHADGFIQGAVERIKSSKCFCNSCMGSMALFFLYSPISISSYKLPLCFFFRVYILFDLWILLCEWKPGPSSSISASRPPRLMALMTSRFVACIIFFFTFFILISFPLMLKRSGNFLCFLSSYIHIFTFLLLHLYRGHLPCVG